MSSIEKNENKMTINVLKGKDITYLWYMEMKYNNNKSFNYKINENLDELLKDQIIEIFVYINYFSMSNCVKI